MPADEGWEVQQQWCNPIEWVADGLYFQDLGDPACEPPDIGQVSYIRSIDAFVGSERWFYEFRVFTTGDRSEIPGGGPTSVSAGNAFGELNLAWVASDQVKLVRDGPFRVEFFDITPGVFHRIRLELNNAQPPSYEWFIDSISVSTGLADDVFPSADARIAWRGKAWFLPTENTWDYIRYGDIPLDGSADFNSDGEVDDFEVFYIDECIQRSAEGEPAHPSCSWADVDGDSAVTCDDWLIISDTMWTGAGDPPELPACVVAPIPAASGWSVTVLTLLTLAVATLVYGRSGGCRRLGSRAG